MTTRRAKAEQARERVLEATRELFVSHTSGFTLEEVAGAAGTSVQTVLRTFGSKDGLILEAIGSSRGFVEAFQRAEDDGQAVRQLFDDYEEIGDRVVAMLAAEPRVPGLATVVERGRHHHHDWVRSMFGPALDGLAEGRRAEAEAGLMAATDVYVWKVLRRDLGLGRAVAERVVVRLVRAALGGDPPPVPMTTEPEPEGD